MSKGENMVERCARAVYERAETYPPYALSQMNGKLAEDFASAVIGALMEPTPEMLAAARAAPMPMVLLDSMSARQDLEFKSKLQAALRTALSQPNDEGEGK